MSDKIEATLVNPTVPRSLIEKLREYSFISQETGKECIALDRVLEIIESREISVVDAQISAESILELFMESQTAWEHGDDVTQMLKFGEATDCMKYYFYYKANHGSPIKPVSVSLDKCKLAIQETSAAYLTMGEYARACAKAVLDAAGVAYVD